VNCSNRDTGFDPIEGRMGRARAPGDKPLLFVKDNGALARLGQFILPFSLIG
jgi:hypothetical protein